MTQTLTAHKVGSTSRRPRTYKSERICEERACTTVISRYNKSDHCHTHAAPVFPRLRGVITQS